MHVIDYDSVKLTNYVQRFAIVTRIHNGAAEFMLLVQLTNNERVETYDDTYTDPNVLLHDLRNWWYLGHGMQEPSYYEAVRDLTEYVVGTLPCHASIWQKSCDFGLYRQRPTIPDCPIKQPMIYLQVKQSPREGI